MSESRSAGSIVEKKTKPVRISLSSITESSKPFLQARAMGVPQDLEAGASAVPSVAGGVLPLIQRLRDALETEGVLHCQWKGHWKRERWARGQGDIDLLVARADVQRFVRVLAEVGFKQVRPPAERAIPGVSSYFGFDREANQFIHVHAHHQLVFGHYLTANYHLPIEAPFLESAIPGPVFYVPAPEFEWIVFVIRALLSYRMSAISRQWLAWRTGAQDELEYLKNRSNRGAVNAVLEQHLPFIDPGFFAACVQALDAGCPGRTRLALSRKLHRRLRPYTRRSAFNDALYRFAARVTGRIRCGILRHTSGNRLAAGGKMIALVGGDGAGKSTAVEELYGWLSPYFDTKRVHLGKPPRSVFTLAVAVMRRIQLAGAYCVAWMRGSDSRANRNDTRPGFLLLLRSLSVAYDRYRLYVKARRFATNGGLVICDRFPVPQITAMDGPNIAKKLNGDKRSGFAHLLLREEAWFYRRILSPDLLVVLRVDPEIAARRKTDEDGVYVRARSGEVWNVDWDGSRAHVLDAGQPVAKVLSRLKEITWEQL